MKKSALTLVLTAATVMLATSAGAQSFKPEDAIRYRKASFTVLATHFSRLGAMASGKIPFDAKSAADNADVVATAIKLPWAAFTDGSDQGETKAKPEVWKDVNKFKAAADKSQTEVAKLAAAAKTGSLDNLKAAFGPAAETCKSCHDGFRSK